jgi:hypothetical protein
MVLIASKAEIKNTVEVHRHAWYQLLYYTVFISFNDKKFVNKIILFTYRVQNGQNNFYRPIL